MSAPSSVVYLDIVSCQAGDVTITWTRDGAAWECVLGATQLARRQALVARLDELEPRYGRGYWMTGQVALDHGIDEYGAARADLCLWDFSNLVEPILCELPGPCVVLFPGRSPLPRFSVRRAMRQGALAGRVSRDRLLALRSIPLWGGQGCFLADELARADRLPVVDPERTCVLLAPFPPNWKQALVDICSRDDNIEHVAQEMAPDLRQLYYTHILHKAVIAEARAAGVDVLVDAGVQDLAEALEDRGDAETLIVIAHQDAGLLYLADGELPIEYLRSYLAATRPRNMYGTVDLAVCGAESDHGLAELIQSRGVPLVFTRGPSAFYARALAHWRLAFSVLSERGPVDLPRLSELVWLACAGISGPPDE